MCSYYLELSPVFSSSSFALRLANCFGNTYRYLKNQRQNSRTSSASLLSAHFFPLAPCAPNFPPNLPSCAHCLSSGVILRLVSKSSICSKRSLPSAPKSFMASSKALLHITTQLFQF